MLGLQPQIARVGSRLGPQTGGMSERFKEIVLKTIVGESPPWVRIPLPPPIQLASLVLFVAN